MSLMKNNNGDELLKFIPIQKEESLDITQYKPFTHSLIILKFKGKTLLVQDRHKNCWEIPGGRIEPGETPRMCIIRELKEETGQEPSSFQLSGVMQIYAKEKKRVENGALYSGTQDEKRPFVENNETTKIIYWDGHSDIGYIDEIDKKLTELV